MPKKSNVKSEWEEKFIEKLKLYHKKNIPVVAKKLLRKIDSAKNSMVTRSKKYNVECDITVEDLRQLTYANYGQPCKYSKRILKIDNIVFDHKIPVSKGGPSTVDNIQIISKFSNGVKGSLSEEDFLTLMAWLDSVPFGKDIAIRLAGGIR